MKRLYAPWRTDYVQRNRDQDMLDACVFCTQLSADTDDTFFIIKRYTLCAVMLNKYPYNAGHLLVIPYAHTSTLSQLTPDCLAQIMHVASHATDLLTKTVQAKGCNIGINIGRAAGASICDHMHMHVLPRWDGDTNFLPALTETKNISVDLVQIFEQLKKAFMHNV